MQKTFSKIKRLIVYSSF